MLRFGVKFSTKALCFLAPFVPASLYQIVMLCLAVSQHYYWQNLLNDGLNHKTKVCNDMIWLKWKRPEDYHKYMVLWLFNKVPMANVKFEGEADDVVGITRSFLRVTCTNSRIYELVLKQIASAPFGLIRVDKTELQPDGAYNLKLVWYSSSQLPYNDKLPQVEDKLILNLQSIIMLGNEWSVKLNGEWITNKSNNVDRNPYITKVTKSLVEIVVRTPFDTKTMQLRCGQSAEVKYETC